MSNQDAEVPGWRWWGAGGGLLLGLIDVGCALLIGMDMQVGGADVTPWVAVYLAGSFAFLGFAAGYAFEGRRRQQLAAERVAAQAAELTAARERVAQTEQLAALGQLSAAIAHEVRNPLAIIRSSVQNLAEDLEDEADAQEACRFVQEEIDRLTRVTATLLDLARPLELERQPVPVDQLVQRTALLGREVLAPRGIELLTEVSSGASVDVDRDLLCQVLLGLLGNAALVAPEGSQVLLSGGHAADGVELRVVDRGPGVPAELREKIFEPFYTTRSGGHGLGLAVARQIVEAHSGQLSVDAGPEGGAAFVVRLPEAA